tara:strand:- start:37 stop:324 length:288 start_codon:yes stop_codon:yes gene_type:complete
MNALKMYSLIKLLYPNSEFDFAAYLIDNTITISNLDHPSSTTKITIENRSSSWRATIGDSMDSWETLESSSLSSLLIKTSRIWRGSILPSLTDKP